MQFGHFDPNVNLLIFAKNLLDLSQSENNSVFVLENNAGSFGVSNSLKLIDDLFLIFGEKSIKSERVCREARGDQREMNRIWAWKSHDLDVGDQRGVDEPMARI